MLKRIGFREIFLPKIVPQNIGFRSADVSFTEDAQLTIAPELLETMNRVNWFEPVSADIWERVSQDFDVAFFIGHDLKAVRSLLEHFKGAAIWRAYGLDRDSSYTKLADLVTGNERAIRRARGRFWLGEAYENLSEIEEEDIRKRAIYLPLGMPDAGMNDQWEGGDSRILFVCPDIVANSYYRKIYEDFRRDFDDLPHAIGGAQSLKVDNTNVLGFLPLGEHQRNMRRMRAMFYHSREPRHIHYHPFEAVRAGMPLIFMGGGLLDRLGGRNLPGRAETIDEARALLKRLLGGDRRLIDSVRNTQPRLLEPMKADNCVEDWQRGFQRILNELDESRQKIASHSSRAKRIAVIVPGVYRGGTLSAAKAVALALKTGSEFDGEAAEIVLGHLDDTECYPEDQFHDLEGRVSRRPFHWTLLSAEQARRAMHYQGFTRWQPLYPTYCAPDDGIAHFTDCDLIVFISDRISTPVLPLRPYAVIVYDYLQRYFPVLPPGADTPFILASRQAQRVFVTTEFTKIDAIDYAGVPREKVVRLPFVAPKLSAPHIATAAKEPPYFLWTTNRGIHKNHARALKALEIYYSELGGKLDCIITGVGTDNLFSPPTSEGNTQQGLRAIRPDTHTRIKPLGEVPDSRFCQLLAGATFLWHPALLDNGTFSVVEAAQLGVPSLSSHYPAMRELATQFNLPLTFFDPRNARDMASRLKWMELNHEVKRVALPNRDALEASSGDAVAVTYWRQVRRCL